MSSSTTTLSKRKCLRKSHRNRSRTTDLSKPAREYRRAVAENNATRAKALPAAEKLLNRFDEFAKITDKDKRKTFLSPAEIATLKKASLSYSEMLANGGAAPQAKVEKPVQPKTTTDTSTVDLHQLEASRNAAFKAAREAFDAGDDDDKTANLIGSLRTCRLRL